MTLTKFKKVVDGAELNSWITLEGICKGFLLNNEGRLSVSPLTNQFYIDTDSSLIFVRNTLQRYRGNDNLVEVEILNVDEPVKVQLIGGGFKDKQIGVYHSVIDISSIVLSF